MSAELSVTFPCFGGRAALHASVEPGGRAAAWRALTLAQATLRDVHRTLTRFDAGSELSRLNADPRSTVPAGRLLRRFVAAAAEAAARSGGLVDAACLPALLAAGYTGDLDSAARAEPGDVLSALPPAAPGAPAGIAWWRDVRVDDEGRAVTRPAGLQLDSGGIAKGMAADLAAALLARRRTFAVDCAGDVRVGGTGGVPWAIDVADPFDEHRTLERFELARGAIATSGITRRTWRSPAGRAAHHLIDPATGMPARTGLVQVTALAPTGVEAETLAKAALLAGPAGAAAWLVHGGLAVAEDGDTLLVDAVQARAA